MAIHRGVLPVLAVLLCVTVVAATSSHSIAAKLADDVSKLDAPEAQALLETVEALQAALKKEANDDLQFLPVFGNVIEYSYQTLIGAASYVWPYVTPIGPPLVEAYSAAAAALSDALASVENVCRNISAQALDLYHTHAEAHVGKYVDVVVEKVQATIASAKAEVAAWRARAIARLISRNSENEDFAEVAIDAFMVSQGGAAALVLVWVWWNYVVVAFMRMLCCRKRVSKKKKKARAAVQAAKAAKKQTKQKNAKQSQKKAQAAAESSDDSDVDEPSNAELAALVARKKLKKRRR